MLDKIKIVLKNSVFQYILSRYATYFIQFINSIFIAVLLGPFYLGIWGFITLILQYFNLINFGIPLSLNTLASVDRENKIYVGSIFNTSTILLIILSSVIGLLFLLNSILHFDFGVKFEFAKYSFIVFLIVFINNILNNFFYIFRIYGKIFEIAFNQTIFPVLMLVCIAFFRGEQLLLSLVWANFLAFLLSLILYIYKSPVKLNFSFSLKLARTIQIKGWYLFLFTSSFYFILMSVRTIVSKYYNVSEFGYFTFSFSLANVILLLFQSFATLVFPKILNKLAKSSNKESLIFIHKIRNSYIGLSHLLVHVIILCFPVFLYFFTKYQAILPCFRFTTLTLVLFTNSTGYQDLLIARNKEKMLSKLSFITLAINVSIALLMVHFGIHYQYIILSTTIAMLFFSFIIAKEGTKLIGLKMTLREVMGEVMPLGIALPYFSSLLLLIINVSNVFYLIPCLLYFMLNIKNIKTSYSMIVDLAKRPNMVNF